MRKVLVVEDEAIIGLDLVSALEAMGYEVLGPACSGAEAKRIASSERPDLLLMDVTIQGAADGIETARAIAEFLPAKVIFLTAHTDIATRARAEALHPEAFLMKPWSNRQMQAALAAAFAA